MLQYTAHQGLAPLQCLINKAPAVSTITGPGGRAPAVFRGPRPALVPGRCQALRPRVRFGRPRRRKSHLGRPAPQSTWACSDVRAPPPYVAPPSVVAWPPLGHRAHKPSASASAASAAFPPRSQTTGPLGCLIFPGRNSKYAPEKRLLANRHCRLSLQAENYLN